ncbi:12-(S)-hydroxy-5,8,10,14-eicosatetraenoic acid receptor-like [Diretmus argenteus]
MGNVIDNSTHSAIEACQVTNHGLYNFYAAITIVIFILALPLNASVLHLFIFKLKFWKSNTNNIFLFNLVLADILLLICLPVKAYNFIHGERRSSNDTVCKAMLFMLFLNRGASIAFLTVTSIDRYFNVVHPGRKNLLRALKKSPQISILIWLLLLPLTIPTMLKNFECCNSFNTNDDALIKDVVDGLREVVFFTQILIPFTILVYCTVRIVNRLRKKTIGDKTKLRRAVFLVTSVMVVFSICFLPCTVARMFLLIARQDHSFLAEDIAAEVFDGLMVFSYMDCLLDPLVYCFCSTKFKSLYLSNYFPFLLKGDAVMTDSSTGNNTSNPRRNNVI